MDRDQAKIDAHDEAIKAEAETLMRTNKRKVHQAIYRSTTKKLHDEYALTHEQERFCELVAGGMPRFVAYRTVRPEVGEAGARRGAERWGKVLGVQRRIAEIGGATKLARWTADRKLEALENIIDNCKDDLPAVAVAAIKIHNEMTGDDQPQRRVIAQSVGEGFDRDRLLRIAGVVDDDSRSAPRIAETVPTLGDGETIDGDALQ